MTVNLEEVEQEGQSSSSQPDQELTMWRSECRCSGICMGELVHLSDYLPFIDDAVDSLSQPNFVPKSVSSSGLKEKEEDNIDDMYHSTLNPNHRSLPRHATARVQNQDHHDAQVVWLGRYPSSFVAGTPNASSAHVSQPYELSYELSKKNAEMLEKKYGGKSRAHWAAATIQRAYRRHSLQKTFKHVMDMNRRRQKINTPSPYASHRAETPAILRLHRYTDARMSPPQHQNSEPILKTTPTIAPTPVVMCTPRSNRVIVYDSSTPSPVAHVRPPNVRVSMGSRQRSISAERSKTGRTAQTKQRLQMHVVSPNQHQPPRILSNERDVFLPAGTGTPVVPVAPAAAGVYGGPTVYAECPAYPSSAYSESSVSSPCSDTSYSASSSTANLDSPSKNSTYASVPSPSANRPFLVDAGASAVYATRNDIVEERVNHSPRANPTVSPLNHAMSPRSSVSPIWVPRLSGHASPRQMSPLATPRGEHRSALPVHESQSAPKFLPVQEVAPLHISQSEMHRKRQYRIALNFFNKKPDRGMQFLIDFGFVEPDPAAVAKFLLTRRGLSKQMIGEYLGNLQNSFNCAVLECFVNEVELHMLDLDIALRKFQGYFRLPGEAQKIERVIEVFSRRFCDCNPDYVRQFAAMDTVFVLAFAIIMLNTDLHSPSIKPERRMKMEDFIKNLRSVDDGKDINQRLLEGIYHRVRAHEFRFASDHVTQVMKVDRNIVGKKPTLAVPHRRLVCYCRLYEVIDSHKKQSSTAHQREIFLFNDLLVITKVLSRKKNIVTYSYRGSHSLVGMQLQHFKNNNYPHGLRIHLSLENKVLLFHARSDEDKARFMEDLKESIMESDEMEAIRIELELEKQSLTRPMAAANPMTARVETQRDSGLPDLDENEQLQLRVGQRALSNSMLELVGQDKPSSLVAGPAAQARARTPENARRASVNSLDSGMSSTASVESREGSPKSSDIVLPNITVRTKNSDQPPAPIPVVVQKSSVSSQV